MHSVDSTCLATWSDQLELGEYHAIGDDGDDADYGDEDDADDGDDDIYIMVKCLSRFCLFHFFPFLGTFGFRNKRKSV